MDDGSDNDDKVGGDGIDGKVGGDIDKTLSNTSTRAPNRATG